MLWDKKKYEIKLKGGRATLLTDPMHGLIKHLIIIPGNKETIWSMDIFDKSEDIIYQIIDHEGRLDDKEGLPVGLDSQEKLTVKIYDTTFNDTMNIFFKIQEIR